MRLETPRNSVRAVVMSIQEEVVIAANHFNLYHIFMILVTILAATLAGGAHDFDFNIGTWKTHIRRLQASAWVENDGTVTVRKVWNGKANLEEIEAGPIEGATLRLYNQKTRQWGLYWSNAAQGTIDPPLFGEFRDGVGEFYGQDHANGRAVLVRQRFFDITPDSYRFEQAFSADQGKTWEANFVAELKRTSAEPAAQTVSAANRNRDFDFHFGTWKTHVRRLMEPLAGSAKWVEYDGTS